MPLLTAAHNYLALFVCYWWPLVLRFKPQFRQSVLKSLDIVSFQQIRLDSAWRLGPPISFDQLTYSLGAGRLEACIERLRVCLLHPSASSGREQLRRSATSRKVNSEEHDA